ncbi:undecaprenyl-diphosphatase [Nakamurella sp. UYEF19]|uniref:phosphatase PAP2 family protein n=1 Tax=Nakamurella sp. UYEF19 TaxID=1756392 RepID=UPI00339B5259
MTWVAEHRTLWATRVSNLLFSASGNRRVIGGLLLLAAVLLAIRRRWGVVFVVGSAAVASVVLTGLLKMLIGRPRPPVGLAIVEAVGYSMPSTDGALTASAALALFLVTAWPTQNARRVGAAILGAAVLLIGACLVYLGAHWPSDVLAGWLVGALIAWACYRVQRWIFPSRANLSAPDLPRACNGCLDPARPGMGTRGGRCSCGRRPCNKRHGSCH